MVTVGYGNMLPTATAATGAPFKKKDGSSPTADEIKAEWTLIRSKEAGKLAKF